jgi:hypothetical protein
VPRIYQEEASLFNADAIEEDEVAESGSAGRSYCPSE